MSELSNIAIEQMQEKHLLGVAKCHIKAFNTQFLSRMGKESVAGLYRRYLNNNDVALVAIINENVVGFVSGGDEDILLAHRAELLKVKPFRYICSLLNPSVMQSILNTIISKFKNNKVSSMDKDIYHLSVIAVDDEYKGQNISKKLIQLFEKNVKGRDYKGYYLTVSQDNFRAINFYKKSGMSENSKEQGSLTMMKYF